VTQSVLAATGLGGRGAAEVSLDPNFEYLRVTRGAHVGWMWLGNTERSSAGPVYVYYSKPGEILRIQNGRIVGAMGLTTEWQNVSVSAVPWRATAESARSIPVERVRDVMPGYRAGVRDQLEVRVIPAPSANKLLRLDPNALTWFEERMQKAASGSTATALPPAKYAVDLADSRETVVYAEQCLAQDVCFTWQRWSASMQPVKPPIAP